MAGDHQSSRQIVALRDLAKERHGVTQTVPPELVYSYYLGAGSTVNHSRSFSTPNLEGMIYVETVKVVPTSFHLPSSPRLPWLRPSSSHIAIQGK
ncbi:hypothetical protein TNCV_1479151 [Trichonephila clavipes]|nr:hypothetical protein TNCV_1479151 [Trichonephila clavipes]